MPAMLATLGGTLALLCGLAILFLPLLANELSRPGDSGWGAVILLLGLVLVTSSDRLTGAPMLAVLCGALLIGRLGSEVGQARWRQLGPEERQRLWSSERWRSSLAQLGASLAALVERTGTAAAGLAGWIAERRQPRGTSKRWVRPEAPPDPAAASDPAAAHEPGAASVSATAVGPEEGPEEGRPDGRQEAVKAEGVNNEEAPVVSGFAAIDDLLAAAAGHDLPAEEGSEAPQPLAGTATAEESVAAAIPAAAEPAGEEQGESGGATGKGEAG